jgi:hypothetical protein
MLEKSIASFRANAWATGGKGCHIGLPLSMHYNRFSFYMLRIRWSARADKVFIGY